MKDLVETLGIKKSVVLNYIHVLAKGRGAEGAGILRAAMIRRNRWSYRSAPPLRPFGKTPRPAGSDSPAPLSDG